MTDTQWTVSPEEAGVRLDKFLAAPGRVASRAQAVRALERGKIYVNDGEAALRSDERRGGTEC